MDVKGIIESVETQLLQMGDFERVNAHEPKNAPPNGVTAAVWVDQLQPVAEASGLAVTSAKLVLNVRVYQSFLSEPQDAIDPAVVGATDKVIDKFADNFTLDGAVMNVDLLGAHGEPLGARAGYLNQDGKMLRVMTITVPLIVSDVWSQTA